jgi:hypothetical protein
MLGKGPIKSVLAEELRNSFQMKEGYERDLKALPKGSMSRRSIGGHAYYYLVQRRGKKVVFSYRGKVSEKELRRYEDAKKKRVQYRQLLSRVKRQIRFLKGALRGKEPI